MCVCVLGFFGGLLRWFNVLDVFLLVFGNFGAKLVYLALPIIRHIYNT